MTDDKGRLFRTWRKGKAKLNAYLDDYAFLISGLIALHVATDDARWLAAAERYQQKQDELFRAEEVGGYYFTTHDHEELITRTRNANDGVIPSGNSVSVRNLVRLARLTGKAAYRDSAKVTLDAFAEQMRVRGGEVANMGLALLEYLDEDDVSNAKLSRDALERTVFQVQDTRTSGAEDKKDDKEQNKKKKPLEARAFLSVDKLPAGGKARVAMYCRIRKGWHINTNKPSPDYVYATTFSVKSKLGSKLVAVQYPKFKTKKVPGEKQPFHLYDGTIVIYGLLEVPAKARGKTEELTLTIDYQSCDDSTGTCLRPDKLVLNGKLKVVDSTQVTQINKDKFVVAKSNPKKGAVKR